MFPQLRPSNRYTKPPLGARVDPLHPLAPYTAWLLNEGAGTQLFEAAQGDRSINFANAPIWVPTQGNGGYGPALRFAKASSQYVYLTDIRYGVFIENPRNIPLVSHNNAPFTFCV